MSKLKNSRISLKYADCPLLDGSTQKLVKQVGDGSIIKRFDRTPIPKSLSDVVCPHFLELKWANGCPFDCAWCYLKGTFRFLDRKTKPFIKDYDLIETHLTQFFNSETETKEVLNTGELADSLMYEDCKTPFTKFIIPLFEIQKKHKVLFLSKVTSVQNLLEIESHQQVIVSFSLNCGEVANRWEKAPKIKDRILSAKKVSEAGYETRLRIDPMVPIENWKSHYFELVDQIFSNLKPSRITLGSLRGLQSTINQATDKSWTKYLSETSNWGKKVDFKTRYEMNLTIVNYLKDEYQFTNVALCKETLQMWRELGLDYRKIKCNCVL